MNNLCWDVGHLGKMGKGKMVADVCRKSKADIICLEETKIHTLINGVENTSRRRESRTDKQKIGRGFRGDYDGI